MKLYLDDIRNPHQSGYQDNEWIVCRNDKTFKDMFISFDSIITHISFDNDLANFDSDGNEDEVEIIESREYNFILMELGGVNTTLMFTISN